MFARTHAHVHTCCIHIEIATMHNSYGIVYTPVSTYMYKEDSEYKGTMATHEIKHCIITTRNVFACEEVFYRNITVVIIL